MVTTATPWTTTATTCGQLQQQQQQHRRRHKKQQQQRRRRGQLEQNTEQRFLMLSILTLDLGRLINFKSI